MTVIKKIVASQEQDNILKHYLLLDPQSLYQRFNSRFNDYTLKNYVSAIKDNDICIGIYLEDNQLKNSERLLEQQYKIESSEDKNTLVGFLHLSFYEGGAEIGLSIIKKYQGFGLSNVLMSMAISELYLKINAENINIKEVVMHCDASNKASIVLGKKFGLKVIIENQCSSTVIEQSKRFEKI